MELNETKGISFDSPEYKALIPFLYGPYNFAMLNAGIELGLFSHLSPNGKTKEELSKLIEIPATSLRTLLLCCCSVGLITFKDGKYFNADFVEKLCVEKEGQHSAIPAIKVTHHWHYRALFRTVDSLKAGTNCGIEENIDEIGDLYDVNKGDTLERLFNHMKWTWDLSHEGLDNLPEYQSAKKILDVCGGDAETASLLVERYPQLHVTVFERPSVCEMADKNIAKWGKEEQISTLPGDLFEDDFPQGYDMINFAHIFEWLTEEDIDGILKKVFKALPSGGCVGCFQHAANEDETGPLSSFASRMSLVFLVVSTGKGITYPPKDLQRMFESAGFVDVKIYDNLPLDHAFVTGKKP